jgi:hypothetical protein
VGNDESDVLDEPSWPLGHRRETWDAAGISTMAGIAQSRFFGRFIKGYRRRAKNRSIVHFSIRTVIRNFKFY